MQHGGSVAPEVCLHRRGIFLFTCLVISGKSNNRCNFEGAEVIQDIVPGEDGGIVRVDVLVSVEVPFRVLMLNYSCGILHSFSSGVELVERCNQGQGY